MSFSDRRHILTLLVGLPLAACTFQPAYGPGGTGLALRDQVLVRAPVNRFEFELVARLEERLGRSGRALYGLDYTIRTETSGIAVTEANDITRVRINGEADFTLAAIGETTPVLSGSVGTFTAYSTTGSTLATDAAERDAEDRLMIALADQIMAQLLSGAHSLS